MNSRIPFHLYDITFKYQAMAFRKRQHEYLGLPGDYIRRYPNEIVLRNMEYGRMDELYLVTGDLLVNLEEESGHITEKTLKKFGKYKVFSSYIYSKYVFTAVICKKNPKNFPKEYKLSPTDIIRPKYIYFQQGKLWEKYEKVINKIKQKDKLTDDEALDIAFIPKFISAKDAPFVTQTLARMFKNAIIPDKELKRDVAVILGAMVLKHVKSKTAQNELMGAIDMKQYVDEIEEIMYSKYGETLEKRDETIEELTEELTTMNRKLDNKNQELNTKNKQLTQKDQELNTKNKQLTQKDQELNTKNKELNKIKKEINELCKLEDLNSPKARKILNSMILMK